MAKKVLTRTFLSRYYDFHWSNGDNGNVHAIQDDVDPDSSADYTYDELNRLKTAQSRGFDCNAKYLSGHLKNWGESYSIDAWGNLSGITPTNCNGSGLSQGVNYQNQLTLGDYDASGNLLTGGYSYDAEGRMTSANGTSYGYDGDGNRVSKSSGKLYWYGGGNILAESDSTGNITAEYIFFAGKRVARIDVANSAPTAHYYFSDHLGSADIITGESGVIESESQYYPYGKERVVIAGDANAYKFTGKERDTETGLDYFGARYYGSNMGRFMSPDSTGYSGLTNPQSWNLYAYTLNNPVRYVDPSGHSVECTKEAAACLAAAQQAVGKDAAGQLTTKTTQNWWQKLWGTSTTTLQITGNEADFRKASGNASKLADLINSKTNFEVSIQQRADPSGDGILNKILGTPPGHDMQGAAQAYTPSEGLLPAVFIDPRWEMDKVDTDSIRDHIPPPNMGEKFAHELLGHVWGEMFGGHNAVRDTAANGRDAVNAENEVRRTDPSRGQKTEHHK